MRFSVRDDLPSHERYTVVHTETGGVIGWYNNRETAEAVAKSADERAPKDFTGYPNPFLEEAQQQ